MFGLINANARLYSPYLGRFISPDPLLNSEGGPLGFNPYIYAGNNPYKYIDRNGEFLLIAAYVGVAAIVAGGSYVAYNWDKIHSFGDALGYFGAGAWPVCKTAIYFGVTVAAAALVTAGAFYGGPLVAGALGVTADLGVAAVTAGVGTVCGAIHNICQTGIDSWFFGTPFEISWQGCLMEAGITGLTAGVGKYIDLKLAARAAKAEIMQTRHRPTAMNPDEIAARAKADGGPKYVNKGEEIQWENPDHIIGTQERVTVNKGTVIDRFSEVGPEGNYNLHLENGTYFSEPGTPYVNRSIPRNPADGFSYGQWEVLKPIQADKSLIAPMPRYNLPGGGVQYRFIDPKTGNYMNVHQLQKQGFIRVFQIKF